MHFSWSEGAAGYSREGRYPQSRGSAVRDKLLSPAWVDGLTCVDPHLRGQVRMSGWTYRLLGWLGLALFASASLAARSPVADVHLHWKWNQKEVITVEEAVATLQAHNIELAVVTGTPPELALELYRAAPDRVIPIYGLYRDPEAWSTWYHDPGLLGRVRKALAGGAYKGIGEVHLIGGFVSHWKNPVIAGLFDMAAEFDVPVLIHVEFSRANYTLGLCNAHPGTRFLLAHAGSMLKPSEVQRVLDGCPNVTVELSARDPWRHQRNRISDESGKLKKEWRDLILAYADRIMIGSDPVWPVERLDAWDEPDTGWRELGRFVDFHLGWLETIPSEQADLIRFENAYRFFRSAE